MKAVLPDLVHAVRVHRATPVASAVAVLILGVAIAFMTAFLTLYSDLLPRGHRGFDEPGRLVTPVIQLSEFDNPLGIRYLGDLSAQVSGIEAAAGVSGGRVEWLAGGGVEPLDAENVSRGFFDVLRPRLALGAGIDPADHADEGAPVAVISHALWQRRFGGRPDVIGREIDLRAEPMGSSDDQERVELGAYRIVGVADPEMKGTFRDGVDLWLAAEQVMPKLMTGRMAMIGLDNMLMFRGVARLVPGRSLESVEREMVAQFDAGAFYTSGVSDDARPRLYPGVTLDPRRQAEARRQVALFTLVGLLVVIVAGANVGLFLLARAPGRRRELGIRLSVGAPMRRLRRQLLIESAVLVAAAAMIGVLLALWLMVGFKELPFLERARFGDVSLLDWRVLGGVLGVAALVTLLVSLAPIAGLGRLGVAGSTRQVRARPGAFQRLGGALQITIAGVVGCVALGFMAHFLDLRARDVGYSADDLVVIAPEIRGVFFSSDVGQAEQTRLRRERQRAALLSIPGVNAVAFGTPVPAGQANFSISYALSPPDRPDEKIDVAVSSVDPAFSELLDLRILHGAWPEAGDVSGRVINRALAEAVFGRTDVIGEVLPPIEGPGLDGAKPVRAVVDNVTFAHPEKPDEPRIYVEHASLSFGDRIVLETGLPLERLRADLDRLIESGELEIGIEHLYRPADRFRELLAPDRGRMSLSLLAAGTALALALFGFYGTQRFLVDAGRREFAILAALGAGPRRIRRQVLARGLGLGLPGLVFMLPLGVIALEMLRGEFLPDTLASPPLVIGMAAALTALLLATSAAPARRAARIAPAAQLRED